MTSSPAPMIFISYQRQSQAVALELNQRLQAAGFRVWQDIFSIRHTERWSQSIQAGLEAAERLVLLMTPRSMQSHEVFNEWFYFYNKRKPLHCLMVEPCEPPYQLLPYQYILWTADKPHDYDRLIAELRAGRASPPPRTSKRRWWPCQMRFCCRLALTRKRCKRCWRPAKRACKTGAGRKADQRPAAQSPPQDEQ
ncbi:MAG: toll/interleukin-1 receptor domain-containing protein, partial [Anaerolineae bacterium]|nr:toll/interleukin-1 receptor domain-containing protein [Anaerolineae bacterium]